MISRVRMAMIQRKRIRSRMMETVRMAEMAQGTMTVRMLETIQETMTVRMPETIQRVAAVRMAATIRMIPRKRTSLIMPDPSTIFWNSVLRPILLRKPGFTGLRIKKRYLTGMAQFCPMTGTTLMILLWKGLP